MPLLVGFDRYVCEWGRKTYMYHYYAGGEHVRALSLLPFLVLCALLLVSPAVGTQGLDDDALGLPRAGRVARDIGPGGNERGNGTATLSPATTPAYTDDGSGHESLPGSGSVETTSASMTSLPTIAPSTGTGASAVTVASMSTLATTGVAVSVPPTQSSSHTGVIIGVVVGVVCVAILVVVLVVLVLRRKARTGRYVGYRMTNMSRNFEDSIEPVTHRNEGFGIWRYDDL